MNEDEKTVRDRLDRLRAAAIARGADMEATAAFLTSLVDLLNDKDDEVARLEGEVADWRERAESRAVCVVCDACLAPVPKAVVEQAKKMQADMVAGGVALDRLTERVGPPTPRPPSPTGEYCHCGGILVRSGTCMTCMDCSSTTGCS